ncbi:MAG TPA: hypothetical protein VN980_17675 [Alphaproteobacteria bacterium]|nr:hypothetical protein [Alphaproteobacteria bacterium]
MANGTFNALPHPAPKEVEAAVAKAASPVWVSQTAYGPAVQQVKQSTLTQNNLYWLNFSNSKSIKTLEFVVTFKAGSPLTTQRQDFAFPGGYAGSTSTPFGVPYWGGNPILGPAVLTAQPSGQPAVTYQFTVVA